MEAAVKFFELALTSVNLQLKVRGYVIVEARRNLCFDEVIDLVCKFPFNYSVGCLVFNQKQNSQLITLFTHVFDNLVLQEIVKDVY